jgi:hypothetical protein
MAVTNLNHLKEIRLVPPDGWLHVERLHDGFRVFLLAR